VPAVEPAADDVDGGVADEDDELEPLFAFVNTNESALAEPDADAELEVPAVAPDVVPEVPTAPPMRSADCRQPVSVTVLALEIELD
jgi:hypothetical protein